MRRRRRGRSALRTAADLMVFAALLAMVVAAAKQGGWLGQLADATGNFSVIDGDSLRKGEAEYRLRGIDAPEMKQSCQREGGGRYPCGEEARQALRSLVTGRRLTCDVSDTDRYGRLLARCRAEALDINAEMVRQGWAVAYLHNDYRAQEREAQASRRGLWQGRFERPQDWRAEHRRELVRSGMTDFGPPD